jgi:hypothetical protein
MFVARCARSDRGRAWWRWKQGSHVDLLFSLEQRIRVGAHAWGSVILGALATGTAAVPWARRWRETVGTSGLVATTGAHGWKTPWWLTCGPSVPFNSICFSKAPASKFTNVIFPMSKNGETFWGDRWDNKEQLFFLPPLPNPSGFWIRKSRNNSNLNLAWILKGFKPFWKNLINPLKFYVPKIYLNIILYWLTSIQILEVSLREVKGLSVFHTQCSWPLRDVGPSNTNTPQIQIWYKVF